MVAADQTASILLTDSLPRIQLAPGDLGTLNLEGFPDSGMLAVPVAPAAPGDHDVQPRAGVVEAATRYGIDLAEFAERSGLNGQAGSIAVLDLPRLHGDRAAKLGWSTLARRIALVGVGAGEPPELRTAGRTLAAHARRGPVLTTVVADSNPAGQQAFVEGFLLGCAPPVRSPGHAKTGQAANEGPSKLILLGEHDGDSVASAELIARSAVLARSLIQLPANVLNTATMADLLPRIADLPGMSTRLVSASDLAERGMTALATLGAEASHPPVLAVVDYHPQTGRAVHQSHVAIVGQGLTFDSGGLSLRRDAMPDAKGDMSGAAVALAVARGAAGLRLPIRVTAVLPLAENAIGTHAARPGDVVQIAGRRVEVTTTNAGGRLLVADAMQWATTELAPDALVDLATATGSMGTIFAHSHAALFSPDDELADQLIQAGARAGEPLWRMPLIEDYRRALDSAVADIGQVAGQAVGAPSIVAALFLHEFAGTSRWAHVDLAGTPGGSGGADGPAGFGTRLLLYWLGAAGRGE